MNDTDFQLIAFGISFVIFIICVIVIIIIIFVISSKKENMQNKLEKMINIESLDTNNLILYLDGKKTHGFLRNIDEDIPIVEKGIETKVKKWKDLSGKNNDFTIIGDIITNDNYIDVINAIGRCPTPKFLNPFDLPSSQLKLSFEIFCRPTNIINSTFFNVRTEDKERFALVHFPWSSNELVFDCDRLRAVLKTQNNVANQDIHLVLTYDGCNNVANIYCNFDGYKFNSEFPNYIRSKTAFRQTNKSNLNNGSFQLWEKFAISSTSENKWSGRVYYFKIYDCVLNPDEIIMKYSTALKSYSLQSQSSSPQSSSPQSSIPQSSSPQSSSPQSSSPQSSSPQSSSPQSNINIINKMLLCSSSTTTNNEYNKNDPNLVFSFNANNMNQSNYVGSISYLKDESLYFNDIMIMGCGSDLPQIENYKYNGKNIKSLLIKYIPNSTLSFKCPNASQFNMSDNHTIEIACIPDQEVTSTILYSFTTQDTTISDSYKRMSLVHFPVGNTVYYDVKGCCSSSNRISYPYIKSSEIKHMVFRTDTSNQVNQRMIIENGVIKAVSESNIPTNNYKWNGKFSLFEGVDGSNKWAGRVFFIRIYNRALSDCEIINNYRKFINQ